MTIKLREVFVISKKALGRRNNLDEGF